MRRIPDANAFEPDLKQSLKHDHPMAASRTADVGSVPGNVRRIRRASNLGITPGRAQAGGDNERHASYFSGFIEHMHQMRVWLYVQIARAELSAPEVPDL